MGSFKRFVERLIFAGLKPDEPAMPGPTSWSKRIGIVAGLLGIGVSVWVLVLVLLHPAQQAEKVEAPPPLLEIVPKDFQVEKNKELEVVAIEFRQNKEPKEITGTLRNLTDRTFAKCEVSFNVTTSNGGELGGAVGTVTGLKPHGSAHFRIPVPYKNAALVMVRELRPE